MNQNYDDLSKQSSGSVPVKEIEVPKNVGDMLESWLNKAKEVGDVRNNIIVVETSGGTYGTKKIMIKNLNHGNMRKIQVVVTKLMETNDSESNEDWDNFMDLIMNDFLRPFSSKCSCLVCLAFVFRHVLFLFWIYKVPIASLDYVQ